MVLGEIQEFAPEIARPSENRDIIILWGSFLAGVGLNSVLLILDDGLNLRNDSPILLFVRYRLDVGIVKGGIGLQFDYVI